jgi:hypothetical protein
VGRDDDTTTWSAKHTDFNTSALALALALALPSYLNTTKTL